MERVDDPFAMAFVLAAIAAGDGAVSRSATSSELRARIDAVLGEVRGGMQRDRAAAMSGLASALVLKLPEDAELPVRARGIVATLVRKELGAAWMREAQPPRAGFRTSGALKRTLVALAERTWPA